MPAAQRRTGDGGRTVIDDGFDIADGGVDLEDHDPRNSIGVVATDLADDGLKGTQVGLGFVGQGRCTE